MIRPNIEEHFIMSPNQNITPIIYLKENDHTQKKKKEKKLC